MTLAVAVLFCAVQLCIWQVSFVSWVVHENLFAQCCGVYVSVNLCRAYALMPQHCLYDP